MVAADRDALLRMTEGFGSAVATSAAMRSAGHSAGAIALALAERAHALQAGRNAEQAGWLLLSIQLEFRTVAPSISLPRRDAAAQLLRDV